MCRTEGFINKSFFVFLTSDFGQWFHFCGKINGNCFIRFKLYCFADSGIARQKLKKNVMILNAMFYSGNVRNIVNIEMYYCFVDITIAECSGSFKIT
jgi:hypothetical protein